MTMPTLRKQVVPQLLQTAGAIEGELGAGAGRRDGLVLKGTADRKDLR
jgi:hypothetical protein